ncbi:hypothetical protein [Bradyrhizobium sp. 150]|uniref:hypothetical protein n=1 Tax=Bradyrhizobium sp. 150 TaxID=2782625 RepID=UPI001FFA879C|nr:hypothetical protein [Bradyrhizobium sp. 150]MCK1672688.1 hypothetical protein [Bradyrhizobium sp. 150]
MCQDWFSVGGQLLDLTGFYIIAWEWYHQLKRDHDKRMGELKKAYDQQAAEIDGIKYVDPDNDKDNWRIFQPLFLAEWRWRRLMFIIGAACFTLGIIGQVLGSWPNLIAKCG